MTTLTYLNHWLAQTDSMQSATPTSDVHPSPTTSNISDLLQQDSPTQNPTDVMQSAGTLDPLQTGHRTTLDLNQVL